MRTWRILDAVLPISLIVLMLGSGVSAVLFGQPPKTDVKLIQTKVFRLNHCDADEFRQVLESILDPVPPMPPMPPPAVPGTPVGGFGVLGFGGAGFGGEVPAFHIVVEQRTRSVIVRGTEKNVRLAAEVVAVLDQPPNKPLPEVKGLRALPLKHASADELTQTLQELMLEARIVPLAAAKMILVAGEEASMKEVTDLIKDLDVPTAKELKPGEKRQLQSDVVPPGL